MIVHGKVNFVKSIALSYMCPLIRNVWLRNIFHDLGVKSGRSHKKYALKRRVMIVWSQAVSFKIPNANSK